MESIKNMSFLIFQFKTFVDFERGGGVDLASFFQGGIWIEIINWQLHPNQAGLINEGDASSCQHTVWTAVCPRLQLES